jgi:hypothetical protein
LQRAIVSSESNRRTKEERNNACLFTAMKLIPFNALQTPLRAKAT